MGESSEPGDPRAIYPESWRDRKASHEPFDRATFKIVERKRPETCLPVGSPGERCDDYISLWSLLDPHASAGQTRRQGRDVQAMSARHDVPEDVDSGAAAPGTEIAAPGPEGRESGIPGGDGRARRGVRGARDRPALTALSAGGLEHPHPRQRVFDRTPARLSSPFAHERRSLGAFHDLVDELAVLLVVVARDAGKSSCLCLPQKQIGREERKA